ncbi:TetR/AcrR family transcriptional regulator [Promicromonospora sp. NPDC057488]|uniref:TetR/AcrR family transcriptional regulator n=1 Tax=Promicromonospora sp. NPDC057488 TaxID=3346147 RepID=UPI00366F9356
MDTDNEPERPRRADAERNYTRVLDAAFEVFTAQGIQAPISEIARAAGVGAGTIYRHFPTKEDLFRAVVEDRFGRVARHGEQLRDELPRGEAFEAFVRYLLVEGGGNRALADAIIGSQFDVLEAESSFLDVLEALLRDSQETGRVRRDVGVMEIKALLGACYAVHGYDEDLLEPVLRVLLDGLSSVHDPDRAPTA